MDAWTHDVVVLANIEEDGFAMVIVGCSTCSWQVTLGTRTTPERIIDETRGHRSGGQS